MLFRHEGGSGNSPFVEACVRGHLEVITQPAFVCSLKFTAAVCLCLRRWNMSVHRTFLAAAAWDWFIRLLFLFFRSASCCYTEAYTEALRLSNINIMCPRRVWLSRRFLCPGCTSSCGGWWLGCQPHPRAFQRGVPFRVPVWQAADRRVARYRVQLDDRRLPFDGKLRDSHVLQVWLTLSLSACATCSRPSLVFSVCVYYFLYFLLLEGCHPGFMVRLVCADVC